MGGQSSSSTTQQSSTSPWGPGQAVATGLLGQLNPLVQNSGLNSTESGAINQLTANASDGNPYAGQIGGVASGLLSGGGATNQAGAVNQNYQNYYAATNPLASNTNYDPTSTPGLGTQLAGLSNSILSSVNGQFAAGGRDASPANAQAAAYGLAQGEAPILTQQYNTNVAQQQGAAQNLYNAGNATAGLQSGMTQQGVNNQIQGVQTAGDALTAQNYGPTATLAAQELGQQIPAQNLGLLAQIGLPIAGLGTQTTGQSQTTTNPSLLSELTGLGGLFTAPANGTSAVAGLGQAAAGLGSAASSGLGSLLGLLAL